MPPSPALLQLAARLRQLRTEQSARSNLTQGDLGKALGVSTATIANWENKLGPKLPPRERMLAYAQFFATPRSVAGETQLVPVDRFSGEERVVYQALSDELLSLHDAARGTAPELIVPGRSWHFSDTGPLTLICAQLPKKEAGPLADQAHPNYNELLSFGDVDAMVELHGHARAENPTMEVFFKQAGQVVPDDLSGHLVIIGGIGWNDITKRILEMIQLPVAQQDIPELKTGDIFVVNMDGEEKSFWPRWSDSDPQKLMEDVGLLVRMQNPLNSNRTLTMCNGIHSPGVLGTVRSLTDARLRESNERYIARNFQDSQQFGILMRVQVIEGRAMTPDLSRSDTVLYQWPAGPSGTTESGAIR
jgi:transcriptional regulator with XRE-family HTH domain